MRRSWLFTSGLGGMMAPWIGMMRSISTPDGAPPISSAKSRIWSFYLRNGPGMAFLLRTRLLQNCAPTDPMDKVALCEKGRKRFRWDLHEYRHGNGDVDRLACLERYGLVHASRARAELECGICSSPAVPAEQPTSRAPHLMAIGLIGEPTAFVMGSGGAVKKNWYTPSSAQSSASSFK